MSTQRLKVSQHVVHSFIGVLSELLAVRFEWIDHLDLHPALEPGTVPPGRICQTVTNNLAYPAEEATGLLLRGVGYSIRCKTAGPVSRFATSPWSPGGAVHVAPLPTPLESSWRPS